MTQADLEYNGLISNILENGCWDKPENVRTRYEDGTPATTIALINQQLKFDNSKEIPILTTKRVPQKDPINELFWIWQKMSNVVQELRDMGCTVWDEWENEKGDIGRAYGWQLANKKRKVVIDKLLLDMLKNGELSTSKEFAESEGLTEDDWREAYEELEELTSQGIKEYAPLNQVDYLLYQLKKNPYSRRIKTTLYCIEDLDDMALEPCVYETHWQLWDGKLNLTVNIRSNDMALGNPYNIYQYAILHRLIAQVTGHKVGEICFNIDNAHIYNKHIETIKEQIKGEIHEAPEVWINPEVKSFFDFTIDDIKLLDYKNNGSFRYEIAI